MKDKPMALCPFATHRLIPAGDNDPPIEVVGAILHVDAGNADSLHDYFDGPSGGIESHFHVKRSGEIEQYRDTGREADANNKANSFVQDGVRKGYVSIETQGYAAGEWTPAQVASLKHLLVWLANTHDFEIRKAPSPFGGGVGYHTMFGAPSEWTPVAKSCPGQDRIRQFTTIFVPWFPKALDPPDRMRPESYWLGATGKHVTWLGLRLITHEYAPTVAAGGRPGARYDTDTRAAVARAQRANPDLGENTPGFPGFALLRLLATDPAPSPTEKVAEARPQIRAAIEDLDLAAEGGRKRAATAADLLRQAMAILRPKK